VEDASLHLYVVCSARAEVAESNFRSASANADFRAPLLTGGTSSVRSCSGPYYPQLFLRTSMDFRFRQPFSASPAEPGGLLAETPG